MKFLINLALTLILLTYLLVPKNSYSQKKGDGLAAAAVVGAVGAIGTAIAAAASIEDAKESMERYMVEWILASKDHSKKTTFDLSMIGWEASKREDLNRVSVVGFSYDEGLGWKNVILLVLSPGWINEYGVDFKKVSVYEINKDKFSKLLLAYLNLSKSLDEVEIENLESIPVTTNKSKTRAPIYLISGISTSGIEFENKGGQKFIFQFNQLGNGDDTHTVIDVDEDFKIDFNEGNLNIYFKETKDIIKLKRSFLLEVIKKFWEDKIPIR
jgi:hypothetical protein